MPQSYHAFLGLLAVVVGIAGYVPYYRDIFRGATKPHPFTWLGFGILNGITFMAQVVSGAGPGAWVSAVTTVATLGIAVLAFKGGTKGITLFDRICFGGALVGIALWRLTSDPLWAVVIVSVADLLAFAPTYRKAFLRPREETVALYALSVLKYGISLPALSVVSLATALFPAFIIIANAGIVVLLLIKRANLSRARAV